MPFSDCPWDVLRLRRSFDSRYLPRPLLSGSAVKRPKYIKGEQAPEPSPLLEGKAAQEGLEIAAMLSIQYKMSNHCPFACLHAVNIDRCDAEKQVAPCCIPQAADRVVGVESVESLSIRKSLNTERST
jgi:hypothetical protein